MIDSSELLFVVDANNHPIAPKPRKETHAHGYWHRTAHIWIINDKNQILCQKRSLTKDLYPGKWEPHFGGHLAPHQKYTVGAIQEVNEELGLSLTKNNLTFFTTFKDIQLHEFQGIFYMRWNGQAAAIHFETEEVDLVQWFAIERINQFILVEHSPQWTYPGYIEKLLTFLQKNNHNNTSMEKAQ